MCVCVGVYVWDRKLVIARYNIPIMLHVISVTVMSFSDHAPVSMYPGSVLCIVFEQSGETAWFMYQLYGGLCVVDVSRFYNLPCIQKTQSYMYTHMYTVCVGEAPHLIMEINNGS